MVSIRTLLLNMIYLLHFKLLNVFLSKINLMVPFRLVHFILFFVSLLFIAYLLEDSELFKTFIDRCHIPSFCDMIDKIISCLIRKNTYLLPVLLKDGGLEQSLCDLQLQASEKTLHHEQKFTLDEDIIIQERLSGQMEDNELLLPFTKTDSEIQSTDDDILLSHQNSHHEILKCQKFTNESESKITKNFKMEHLTAKNCIVNTKYVKKTILSARNIRKLDTVLAKMVFCKKCEDSDHHKEIYSALLSMEEKILNEQMFISLLNKTFFRLERLDSVFPSKAQEKKLKRCEKNELVEQEEFLLLLCQIPDFRERIRLIIFSLKVLFLI